MSKGMSIKKLKELQTTFIMILTHYGLTKWEILEIIKKFMIEIKLKLKE